MDEKHACAWSEDQNSGIVCSVGPRTLVDLRLNVPLPALVLCIGSQGGLASRPLSLNQVCRTRRLPAKMYILGVVRKRVSYLAAQRGTCRTDWI